MHIDPEQQQGLAGLHLRSLSQEIRQPYDWMEFRRRSLARTRAEAARKLRNKQYLAIAAALLLVVVGLASWIRATRPGTSELIGSAAPAAVDGLTWDALRKVDTRADIEERWLASLPSEPIVVHVGTRAAVAGLEDRIAQLDDLLSAARVEGTQPPRLAALEEQRARLVSSLVQVRYAETLVAASH